MFERSGLHYETCNGAMESYIVVVVGIDIGLEVGHGFWRERGVEDQWDRLLYRCNRSRAAAKGHHHVVGHLGVWIGEEIAEGDLDGGASCDGASAEIHRLNRGTDRIHHTKLNVISGGLAVAEDCDCWTKEKPRD
jgi:hypothetical protein